MKILMALPIPVVFPCHPRTMSNMRKFGLLRRLQRQRQILFLDPLGYADFLALMRASEFIVTDSAGVTEEATAPGIDKLVFSPRLRTELPEAVKSGHLVLVGPHHSVALQRIRSRLERPFRPRTHPYGIGDAATKIIRVMAKLAG